MTHAPNAARLVRLIGNAQLLPHLATPEAAAAEIRRIWKLERTNETLLSSDQYPSVAHLRQNRGITLKRWEVKLAAINDIVGGYGVESCETEAGNEWLDYVNTGDSYTSTIIHWRGRLSLCEGGIGSFIEANPYPKFK